jgi:hypothetical protein
MKQAWLVLGPHTFQYPLGMGQYTDPVLQKNGQLMGSPLSFPFLCLANLCLYLNVTEKEHRGRGFFTRLRSVAVNGDDMLYLAPPCLWADHVSLGKSVGLEMSVGKAYHHPIYANINSTSFHAGSGATPYQIDFLNTGLFFGIHKTHKDESSHWAYDLTPEKVRSNAEATIRMDMVYGDYNPDLTFEELVEKKISEARMELAADHRTVALSEVDIINQLISGCLPGRQKDLLSMYLKENKENIKCATKCKVLLKGKFRYYNRNLFLPVSSGGMGIAAPCGFKFRITRSDRELYKIMKHKVPTSTIPLRGYRVLEEQQLSVPWGFDPKLLKKKKVVEELNPPTRISRYDDSPLIVGKSCRYTNRRICEQHYPYDACFSAVMA